MATINLPFAAGATKRAPNSDELANGYGCGDADLALFDWLAWWQSGQIAGVLAKSGLAVDDLDIERSLEKALPGWLLSHISIDRQGIGRDLQASGDLHFEDAPEGGIYVFRL